MILATYKITTYINQLITALQALIGAGVIFRIVYSCVKAQSDGESVSAAFKKSGRVLYAGAIAIVAADILGIIQKYVNVSDTATTNTLTTLIKKIFTDATNVLILVEASLIIFNFMKEGILYQSCEAEEKAKHKKNMAAVIGVGILAMASTSLIPVILNYFK